jgi:hypothetical protein
VVPRRVAIELVLSLGPNALIATGAEHSIRQEGVGVFVAISLLARPDVVAPVLTNAFVGFVVCVTGSALVRWRTQRNEPRHASLEPEPL